ncbi:MAG: radical SAM protein [Candidatus Aminicenantes bacterium]|nr:radical SAM protein [Candidatus Aminicenantes bacterium]
MRSTIYGPVPSRRLGYSLGVDILPFKTCSMDCVYCQLGSGAKTTVRRKEYVPAAAVLAQIRAALAGSRRIDAVTFSGSGEPGLNSGIGKIIRGLKRTTDIPVVVLTNSSCLVSQKGRQEFLAADIVVPSLDAATPRIFQKINRPHASLKVDKIIDGLVRFRREFAGRIWLEIMLVKDVNDGPVHLKKLKEAAARIRPDKVQLNTVVRPPAERSARPLNRAQLEKIRVFFGENAEIIADFKAGGRQADAGHIRQAILAAVRRRPMTVRDMSLSLGRPVEEIRRYADDLVEQGRLDRLRHKKSDYYK